MLRAFRSSCSFYSFYAVAGRAGNKTKVVGLEPNHSDTKPVGHGPQGGIRLWTFQIKAHSASSLAWGEGGCIASRYAIR